MSGERLSPATITVSMIVLLSVCLAACGGADRSTSSTGGESVATATASGPAKSAGEAPAPSSASGSVADRSSAGAAGFRVAHGDNSVPDFGQEAHAARRQRAVGSLITFMQARAKGEWSRVCDYLARSKRRPLESIARRSKGKLAGCGTVLAALLTGPAAAHADTLTNGVAALRIKGKTAFALFYGPNAGRYVMPMRSEGGAWKMTQLDPLPYPLGTSAVAP